MPDQAGCDRVTSVARFNGCRGSVHGKAVRVCGSERHLEIFLLDSPYNSVQHHAESAKRTCSIPERYPLPVIPSADGVHGDETSGYVDWCESETGHSRFKYGREQLGYSWYRGLRRAVSSWKSMQGRFRLYVPLLGVISYAGSFFLLPGWKLQ